MLGHDHTKTSEQAFVGDKTNTLTNYSSCYFSNSRQKN